MHEIDKAVPKIARNEMFYFIARLCMMATIPLVAFFGTRIISQADALQTSVSEQNIAIKILSYKLDGNVSQLSDHELRLRQIERSGQR
jgi:hypothetical protein